MLDETEQQPDLVNSEKKKYGASKFLLQGRELRHIPGSGAQPLVRPPLEECLAKNMLPYYGEEKRKREVKAREHDEGGGGGV